MSDNSRKEFIQFVIVTLFGLWVVQNVVIAALTYLVSSWSVSSSAALFVAKLCAIAASLIWNYMWYSRVVFKHKGTV